MLTSHFGGLPEHSPDERFIFYQHTLQIIDILFGADDTKDQAALTGASGKKSRVEQFVARSIKIYS